MATYTLKDGTKREFDFLSINIKIEYLPGKHVTFPLPYEYVNHDLAKLSLESVQKQHPEAYLNGYANIDGLNERQMERIELIASRDKQFIDEIFERVGK